MQDELAPDLRALESEAYHQNGYFSAGQARQQHVSRQLLEHYVRQGRFDRVRRGLYRVHGFPSSEHDDMREAWMAVGAEKAVLSHESALALLGLTDNVPDKVHLLVPRRHRGLRKPPGVALHTRPDDEAVATVWREGLPLTAPARTLVDVMDNLQPEQASMAVRQALAGGLLTRGQLEDEAHRQHKGRFVERLHSAADQT
jgi:predicted transcriptional regulator of viral defense system